MFARSPVHLFLSGYFSSVRLFFLYFWLFIPIPSVNLFIHWHFCLSVNHSFIRLLARLISRLFICSPFNCSSFLLFVCQFIYSLVYWLIHSLVCQFIDLFIDLFIYSSSVFLFCVFIPWPLCLFIHWSFVCSSVDLFVLQSVRLFVCSSIFPFVYPSFRLILFLFVSTCVHSPVRSFVCSIVCLFIHLLLSYQFFCPSVCC